MTRCISTLGLLLSLTLPAQAFTSLVNPQCVQWKLLGPCVCPPFRPCVTVEYWEPAWLIETVKHPGTTVFSALAPFLNAALGALGIPELGGGGAATATGSGQTNLQYNEVHVYPFPNLLGSPCTGCVPVENPPLLHYASEIDPAWRTATAVPSPLSRLQTLGVWAPLYPRGGKAIHSSEPVGSGIAAARALDIAYRPIGMPPNVDTHVIVQPTDGTSQCCQLAWPVQTPCFPVGTVPALWETGTVSPLGTYAWVFWRVRRCCVPPDQARCGITLVSGTGANLCPPLPSVP